MATTERSSRGVVLVTGASTGLGRAAAIRLAEQGFQVIAGVRKDADGAELAAASPQAPVTPVRLDVTSEAEIERAVGVVAQRCGDAGLRGLVNNAGICVCAPLETVTSAQLREQLEVNVIGALAVTRAFLPLLRTGPSGAGPVGRIVNVSSGVGRLASPFLGAYAAAQFAKEGMSDALRRELAAQSISVSVIEPGAIMTPIWGKISEAADRVLPGVDPAVAEFYREPFAAFVRMNDGLARDSRTTPEQFARTVERALTDRKPKTRYRVGVDAVGGSLAARLLPDRALDAMLRAMHRMSRPTPAATGEASS
ncbi:SDR family oxidoreductase [Nocardia shimofusensis]|uniref:SDR family oxidoreductase n=1 Tax=Nocardia shimofusensis TaxID=228596 RepID=UPI0008379225|nr:SDR family oxidoreductase [Nocardia shimofusensis]